MKKLRITSTNCYLMLFLLQELYANMISEKATGACDQFMVHYNRPMHRQHPIGVGSLARYNGEAMDGPPTIMGEKSFDITAILFKLASNANKNKQEDHLKHHRGLKHQPLNLPKLACSFKLGIATNNLNLTISC
jgi:hypothetical protein